jgi:2-oxoisovalerate dehydrogenase E2 component (dihydrolipoyl transacylase)
MGMHVFRLPDVGEGIAEAEIVAWHVKVGESVKEDQPLVDVMTEKATVEIGAPVSGKVVERKGEAGDRVPVGTELVVIATDGGRSPSPLAGEGRGRGQRRPLKRWKRAPHHRRS